MKDTLSTILATSTVPADLAITYTIPSPLMPGQGQRVPHEYAQFQRAS